MASDKDIPALIADASGRLTAIHAELMAAAASLTDRDVVMAVAVDAVLADEAFTVIEQIDKAVKTVKARIDKVRDLAAAIDQAADPMTLIEVE